MLLSEPSRRLAEYARDAGRMYGSCTPSLPPWRDSQIVGPSKLLCQVTSASAQPAARDLDFADISSRPELRCSAKNDDFRLVCVEL